MPVSTLWCQQMMRVASDIYLTLIMYQVLFQTLYLHEFVNYWNSFITAASFGSSHWKLRHRYIVQSHLACKRASRDLNSGILTSEPMVQTIRMPFKVPVTCQYQLASCPLARECRIQTVTHITNWVLGVEGGLIAWTVLRWHKGTFEYGRIVKLWKIFL